MDADGDSLAGKRSLGGEALFELPQDRHVASYPFDLLPAVGSKLGGGEDVRLHDGLSMAWIET